jgi:hypothetical protein
LNSKTPIHNNSVVIKYQQVFTINPKYKKSLSFQPKIRAVGKLVKLDDSSNEEEKVRRGRARDKNFLPGEFTESPENSAAAANK